MLLARPFTYGRAGARRGRGRYGVVGGGLRRSSSERIGGERVLRRIDTDRWAGGRDGGGREGGFSVQRAALMDVRRCGCESRAGRVRAGRGIRGKNSRVSDVLGCRSQVVPSLDDWRVAGRSVLYTEWTQLLERVRDLPGIRNGQATAAGRGRREEATKIPFQSPFGVSLSSEAAGSLVLVRNEVTSVGGSAVCGQRSSLVHGRCSGRVGSDNRPRWYKGKR